MSLIIAYTRVYFICFHMLRSYWSRFTSKSHYHWCIRYPVLSVAVSPPPPTIFCIHAFCRSLPVAAAAAAASLHNFRNPPDCRQHQTHVLRMHTHRIAVRLVTDPAQQLTNGYHCHTLGHHIQTQCSGQTFFARVFGHHEILIDDRCGACVAKNRRHGNQWQSTRCAGH